MNATMFSGVTDGGQASGKVRAATSASSGRSASTAVATSTAKAQYTFHWARCCPVILSMSTTLETRSR